MPGSIITYQNTWKAFENENMVLVLEDQTNVEDVTATPQTINVTALGSPFRLSTIDNADDKYSPIKGKAATIQFAKSSNIYASLFASGEDKKWSVRLTYASGAKMPFKGFLVMDDISEPFLPEGEIITLTATDGLGLLKTVELVDQDGAKMRGKYRLIEIVANCLALVGFRTGLQGFIYVFDNLFETDQDNRTANLINCPWNQTYVDMLTFEKAINETEDAYTVLSKILFARGCRLFQKNGDWWIVRTDEYKNLTMYGTRYSAQAVASSAVSAQNFNKVIGKWDGVNFTDSIHQINNDADTRYQRPHKFVKLNYNYEFPAELIKNIDFTRGDENAGLSGVGFTAYDVDDWTKRKSLPDVGSPTFTAYIKRVFDSLNYETERYLVVTQSITPGIEYIESSVMQMCQKDKFEFSVDYKWSANQSGGGSITVDIGMIRLEADDGTKWTLDDDGKWYQSNSSWTTNIKDLESSWVVNDIDETEWRTLSVSSEPMPRTGNVYVMLRAMNQDGGTAIDNVDIYYSNLSFNYHPLINGTYTRFTGETYKVSQVGSYSANREEDLPLSDAPCKPYKGAMFTTQYDQIYSGLSLFNNASLFSVIGDMTSVFTPGKVIRIRNTVSNNGIKTVVSSVFGTHTDVTIVEATVSETAGGNTVDAVTYNALTNLWNDWQITNAGGTGLGPERFAKWQAYAMWNQYRLSNRYFDWTLQGLDLANEHCDLHHRYVISINTPDSQNRMFMLLSYEQDFDKCEWRALMAEIDYTQDQRSFGDDFTFKFLE